MAGKVNEGLVAEAGAAASSLFAANPGRLFLSITNLHATQDLFVRFGGTATTTAGVKIAAGVTRTWGDNTTGAVPGGAVSVIGSGAATTLYAYEHNGDATGA